ncbi:indolepyruvate ferredoxin oxidoreductase subunit alpha [Petroclostridium sp. X23]|uniref:indolepyruvate ferredoxin oxidoreductase subunit alpha n=1 Tax=Petroclostridium sp. X23 TaxID=3045146 RepID=UPI0024ACE2D3|nr:indolepyruvate ferredoxin oxidoreductase subunit alpha [Petroclostridium sp. X23]WHH60326.1 indolepyruvate ferredoxin oxidoreductase subunit alpha [Petroclostridium sp. X23]
MKKLLIGNEAIAFGAIEAGVNVVTGYPGTPSTEMLETIAENNIDEKIYVEWSVNEKVALEIAAGAAYTGAKSMVAMKQVGLNVASDPLMSLSYVGIKGAMIVYVADDPGPFSSQTEQDTRAFGKFANLPVFDPSTPEEAKEMVKECFDISHQFELPVILRTTTRICHSCSTVELTGEIDQSCIEGFTKDARWVIFPSLAYKNHIKLEEKKKELSHIFSSSRFNSFTGTGKKGIAVSGVAYTYLKEVIDELGLSLPVLKIGTPHPFPDELALKFLNSVEDVLVLEELYPVVEEQLKELSLQCEKIPGISGKKTGHMPVAGEYSVELIRNAVCEFLQIPNPAQQVSQIPELPPRPPVLCPGCPHRASFYAFKVATKGKKAVFSGDIGCYTLGNAKPLEAVDTCLCMGAGITIAQGLHRVENDTANIAFIGDSTFFHTGIPGIINAVYNNTDITVAVLDNRTTAMTGNQPHPGTGMTVMGKEAPKLDIYEIVKACGVKCIKKANPLVQKEAVAAAQAAIDFKGPSVVILESPCVVNIKGDTPLAVSEKCIGCNKCIRDLGCPAMYMKEGKPAVEPSLCNGCGLCSQVCPVGAFQPLGGGNNGV